MDAAAGRMAPVLAFRENLMTLQFVHGGVDRDGQAQRPGPCANRARGLPVQADPEGSDALRS